MPDTNVMMDLSFSSLESIVKINLKQNAIIKIPRLCILEMERKVNEKRGASDKGKVDKTKRKVMLASRELLFLKQQGAHFYLN